MHSDDGDDADPHQRRCPTRAGPTRIPAARSPRILRFRLQVDPRQQRVMIGAEHASPAVVRVFVQPVNPGPLMMPSRIAHQKIVQHQPRQRVIGVPPAWEGMAGTPKVNPASPSSRQARSYLPRPRLRSAPEDRGVVVHRRARDVAPAAPGRRRQATCVRVGHVDRDER